MRQKSWASQLRAMQAADRRRQREEAARHRLLERQAKEAAKLSAVEQARLEVSAYDAEIAMLLSVHKDVSTGIDWRAVASSLPPAPPARMSQHELRARQDELLTAAGLSAFAATGYQGAAADARSADDQAFKDAEDSYTAELDEWDEQRNLAQRVLAGDREAFQVVLSDWPLFGDASDVCAAVKATVYDQHLVELQVLVKGTEILPAETKTLTSTGKLSVKATPKGRFHEMFQDYVAGCAIRAARDVFALLPFDVVLVTAFVPVPGEDYTDPAAHKPVLSVVFPSRAFSALQFDTLDPSDTVETFMHRGEVKVSRQTGTFIPIIPLTRLDLKSPHVVATNLETSVAAARTLRERLEADLARAGLLEVTIPTPTDAQ